MLGLIGSPQLHLAGLPLAATVAIACGAALLGFALGAGPLGRRLRPASESRRIAGQLADALDVMSDGLSIWDSRDNLVAWNAGFQEIYTQATNARGAPLRVGMRWGEIALDTQRHDPEIDSARLDAIMIDLHARRRSGEASERQNMDGRWIRTENRRTASGGLVSCYTDITHLKRHAEVLAAAREEAEAANRAKSQFLANMSHEIRTPMNGIMGMNALLLRTGLTPDQFKLADTVRTSAENLLSILNDILDVSKLEAGKVELEAIDFSLQTVIEEVAELCSARALEKGVDLATYADPGARRLFVGDPTRVRQVITNLVSNAIKFTDSGFVAIEARSGPAPGGRTWVKVEVHDSGVGVPEEAKRRLFQKFQQADGSVTRRFGGTGLGLSICRELVALMGGRIGVANHRGGGSTFWFELEFAPGAELQPGGGPIRALRNVRVLVVDDIEINRFIFAEQLAAEGAAVAQASSGHEALLMMETALAAHQPFDVILLDHMMPGLSGEDVAERIRAEGKSAQTRLVLASSLGALPASERAAAFDAVLTKPVRHAELLDCLERVLHPALEAGTDVQGTGAPPPLARPGRVLVVDDHEVNRFVAARILESGGYTVEIARDGAEALSLVQENRFDLILMDVQMPVVDGLEASRAVRALGAHVRQPRIVALTADVMANNRADCIAAGMDDFIEKPFDPERFLETVARNLAGRAPQADKE
jgi:signal transduction histidine kinase/DNA-binding response OmpR family regulator